MQLLELHSINGKPPCARDLLLDGASHWRVSMQTMVKCQGVRRSQVGGLSDKAAAEALTVRLLPDGKGACSGALARVPNHLSTCCRRRSGHQVFACDS